jgi:hypothetical protein
MPRKMAAHESPRTTNAARHGSEAIVRADLKAFCPACCYA